MTPYHTGRSKTTSTYSKVVLFGHTGDEVVPGTPPVRPSCSNTLVPLHYKQEKNTIYSTGTLLSKFLLTFLYHVVQWNLGICTSQCKSLLFCTSITCTVPNLWRTYYCNVVAGSAKSLCYRNCFKITMIPLVALQIV